MGTPITTTKKKWGGLAHKILLRRDANDFSLRNNRTDDRREEMEQADEDESRWVKWKIRD